MPAPAIGVRRRFTPPAPAVVDWSHPIAQGLTHCVTPRGSLLAAPSVSSLIRSSGEFGTALTNNGTGTQLAIDYKLPANGWTHFAAVTVTSVAVSTLASIYRVAQVITTDRLVGIYTGNVWGLYIYDGAVKVATAASAAVGPAVVVGTSSGSSIQTWVNGAPGTAVATSNAGFGYSGDAQYWSLARTTNGNNGFGATDAVFPGVIHIAASWQRVLTTAEIETVSADPFCFLRS